MTTRDSTHDMKTRGARRSGLGALSMMAIAAMIAACSTDSGRAKPLVETRLSESGSLAGVDIDGRLTLSSSGEFELDADARAFFDHFLATEGELDEATLLAGVRAEIDAHLPRAGADQAWEAFLAYLDYRREAAMLLEETSPSDPEAAIEALEEIRERTIGDAPGVPDEGPLLEAAAEMQAALAEPDARTRALALATAQAKVGNATDLEDPSRILRRIHAALAPIPMHDVAARRDVLEALVGEPAAGRWLSLEHQRANDLAPRG